MGKKKPGKSASEEFRGVIVDSAVEAISGALGVRGAQQVWFPRSKSDVEVAVSRSKDQLTLIRSGIQAAATDGANAVGSIVIHLAGLTEITKQSGLVSADAGVTTIALANELELDNLALPVIENPLKSIVANVLDDAPSCLIRTLGPLSKFLTKVTGVTPDGHPISHSGETALTISIKENIVITGLTFEPVPAKGLWCIRKSFLYPGKEFLVALTIAIFVNFQIPKGCDIAIEAISARYDVPVISIVCVGSGLSDRETAVKIVDAAIASLPSGLVDNITTEEQTGASVVRTLVDSGSDIPTDPEVETHRILRSVERQENINEFIDQVLEDLDRGLAFREDEFGKRDENLRLFCRLQLDHEDRLTLSGYAYTQRRSSKILAPLGSTDFVKRKEAPLHTGLKIGPASAARIPGFKGAVYEPTDFLYDLHATQYATSSYKPEDMTPFMVAFPLDVDDIKSALSFAKVKQKKIVARSGGHQYSGLSSGGDGTIVLAMDRFSHLRQVSGNVFDIGPAIPLTTLARFFKDRGVSIPHGECPMVCIGGHAQTGGFGHMLRSFGLTLDYVTAFTIVIADGSVHTVQRPSGAPVSEDDELFWGVLGGNAGSFGIVINYRVECIKDTDHPDCYGYTAIRIYRKNRCKNLMKQVQLWTQGVAAGTLRPDTDFNLTVVSKSNSLRVPLPSLVVEFLCSNLGDADAEQVFAPIMNAADSEPPLWDLRLTRKGTRSLSAWAETFVRRYPAVTTTGREFVQPYKKRVNCTSSPLTDAFVDGYVELADRIVMSTDGVYLNSQMGIGGGSLKNSPRRLATSFPKRDLLFLLTFDIFYDEGYEQVAEQLQDEMQNLIDTHFSPGQEHRVAWGSFGDTDISKDAVRKFYYNDASVYNRLQQLKKRVDPDDIFHTSLTVKLP